MGRAKTVGNQIAGAARIQAALAAGTAIHLLLVLEQAKADETALLLEQARRGGIPIREASASAMRRMSAVSPPAEVLALVGRSPQGDLEDVLARGGAVWTLVDVAYPGNVGMAIRTAEVSGADGVIIDADFDHDMRKAALRASVRADWFMPVLWEKVEVVLDRAEKTEHRILCIEVVGTKAPWEEDLTGPVLFLVGGEAEGIPDAILERANSILRIPMEGFIPAYNLQAAVAAVATERLRQLKR